MNENAGEKKNSVLAFQSPPQRRNTTFLENTYIISIVEEILVFVIVQKSSYNLGFLYLRTSMLKT